MNFCQKIVDFRTMLSIIFTIFIVNTIGSTQDISSAVDTKTLSELPLEKLLAVRKSFQFDEETDGLVEDAPQALELKRKAHDVHGHHTFIIEEYVKDKKKKGLQNVFQISVTALAFLAFGGYLLCLLVQAIKSKNMSTTTTTSPDVIAALFNHRRRKKKKPIQAQHPVYPYRSKRELWNDLDVDNLYGSLITLSEAYANYHTVDYNRLNYSTNYFN